MILLVDFIFARRDICNFIQVKIRFTLQAPICSFDAKNAVLCPKCESKLESGTITSFDVDAAIKLAQLGKKIKKLTNLPFLPARQLTEIICFISKKTTLW